MNDYFVQNNFLTKEQFGFRIKHLTYQVTVDVKNKLQNSSDDKFYRCPIWLDISNAFIQYGGP